MKAKEKNTLSAGQFMSFGAQKEIPQPTEVLKTNRDFVFWGVDNLYPYFITRLMYESALNNGIITQKANYITGNGYEIIGEDEDIKNAAKLFTNGAHDMDFNEVVEHCALDLTLFNSFALRVVKNMEGNFAFMEPEGMERVRCNEDKTMFFVSSNWRKATPDYKEIAALDWSNATQNDGMFYYHAPTKDYDLPRNTTNTNVYSKPEYLGAVKDILSDIEISGYHYYELINGMKAGTMITFTNGEPDTEQRSKIEREFKEGLTPNENAGGIMLHFVDTAEQLPDVKTLNGNDLDKRYLMTANAVKEKIFVGHGITTPALFGVSTPGALGQRTELEVGFQIFVKTWVRKKQQILENMFNALIAEIGYNVKIKFNEPEMPFKPEQPTVPTVMPNTQMQHVDVVLEKLTQCGISAQGVKIIARKQITKGEEALEREFMAMHKQFALATVEVQFLEMLNNGESVNSIKTALDINTNEVFEIYNKLREGGYIDERGKITQSGANELAALTPFRVLYQYDKRFDVAGDKIIEGTRNFCRALINLDRLYTREEIDALDAFTPHGQSAWQYRGGWYNNNGVNQFGCRHTWNMVLIEK